MGFQWWGTGWWEYKRTTQEGRFYCPNEDGARAYRMRRLRRWITVFWLPVVPLGTLGYFVQCRSCKEKYPLDVLRIEAPAAAAPAVQPHEV